MAIWLTAESRILVQNMTGREGSKHTRRMLAAGSAVVGGVNPGKGVTVASNPVARDDAYRRVKAFLREAFAR